MDAAASRLSELKRLLTEIELSEFRYVDGALIEMKLVPHDVEILDVAYCFPRPFEIEEMLEQVTIAYQSTRFYFCACT